MNKGINGLYTIIKSKFPLSPISGDVFIFFAKNRCKVKVLRWDVLLLMMRGISTSGLKKHKRFSLDNQKQYKAT